MLEHEYYQLSFSVMRRHFSYTLTMRSFYVLLLSYVLFMHYQYSHAQSTACSIGIKGSVGVSVPGPHSTLDIGAQSYALRTHASYAGGILGQYVLGGVVGIETGILNTYISYSRKDLSGSYLLQSLGWDANIGINSYLVPIQLMYVLRPGINPDLQIKLTGGIALDWLTQGFLKRQENPLFLSGILCGARIKTRAGKYGRIEYGLEYQYSLQGTYTFEIQAGKDMAVLHSRYSVLSFNLYYFFFNKEHYKD
ncbi:hypothetical protein CHU_0439 [Cytophaga hutchinsonii ATCC 33406]|uniref:Outer membrane protein beta-barrel domain-containing protein n=2 Tax=Cytophaga hutchinsonii TaxID=985 RepID=A0A6N4SN65_CYTH3|nr:hypothetical protein CHU_0439 [Cytophaga hutchinsonii ATCC 33406]